VKIVLDDELHALLFSSSSLDNSDILVVSLNNFSYNAKLTFDMVDANFLNDTTRKKSNIRVTFTQNKVLGMELRGRNSYKNSKKGFIIVASQEGS